MIKLFPISSMQHTPFEPKHFPKDFFSEKNIDLTQDESEADIYLCQSLPVGSKWDLVLFRLRYKRFVPILVWTFEPRYCNITRPFIKGSCYFPDIHIMNLYTEGVFLDNYSLFHQYVNRKLNLVDETHFRNRQKKAVAVNGYVSNNDPFIINGKNIDLTQYRQQLILDGHERGMVDVYGTGWPQNISMNASRQSDNWHELKLEILNDYAFNIALENTNYDYYVSEKIWDSITAGCLPIYFGADNMIYRTFPENSFVDVSKFSNTTKVFNFLSNMSEEEYCERLNRCINVYNSIYSDNLNSFNKVLESVADKILAIHS